jgi:hypothetical protein
MKRFGLSMGSIVRLDAGGEGECSKFEGRGSRVVNAPCSTREAQSSKSKAQRKFQSQRSKLRRNINEAEKREFCLHGAHRPHRRLTERRELWQDEGRNEEAEVRPPEKEERRGKMEKENIFPRIVRNSERSDNGRTEDMARCRKQGTAGWPPRGGRK